MVDKMAKDSDQALVMANKEELRELCRWLLEKEGPSQQDTHTELLRQIDWWQTSGDNKWTSTGYNKGKGKAASERATVEWESSEEGEGQDSETSERSLGDGSDDDDEVQGDKPVDTALGRAQEHDESQGDELGDWFFQSREYLEWKKFPQGLLWLYGNCKSPGCPLSVPEDICPSLSSLIRDTIAGCGKSLLW
jgi:hypothetical protein